MLQIARLLCPLFLSLPLAAAAQETAPVLHRVISPEPCADWQQVLLMSYVVADGPPIYELQKGCFNRNPVALLGPEPMTDLTLVEDGYDTGWVWEDIGSGPSFAERDMLTAFHAGVNPFLGPMPDVLAISAYHFSPFRTSRHTGGSPMGSGYAFPALVEAEAVEGRTFFGTVELGLEARMDYSDPGNLSAYFGSPTYLTFTLQEGRITAAAPNGPSRFSPSLLVFDGWIDGEAAQSALQMEFPNPRPLAAQADGDWTSATVMADDLAGYLVGMADRPMLVVLGLGTVTAASAAGPIVSTAEIRLIAEPLPADTAPGDIWADWEATRRLME